MFQFSFGEMPSRSLVGRVSRVDDLGPGAYGRTSIEVDCVDTQHDAPAIIKQINDGIDTQAFAVLRILTTKRRFKAMVGFAPAKGTWLHLRVGPTDLASRPIVFHSQLRDSGYTEQGRGSLLECDRLFSDLEGEPGPTPLGAAVPNYIGFGRAVEAASSFPSEAITSRSAIEVLLGHCNAVDHIIVRDVGQANFVTLFDAFGKAIAHFDVGWPLSFNGKTAPANFILQADDAPVLLSHWDFDHVHGFYRFPHLQESTWIAPVQKLGPGKARIARLLAGKNRLLGWSGGSVVAGELRLLDCSGTNQSNDIGHALSVKMSDGSMVLCAGDASYSAITESLDYDFLVVTHHGARFNGLVPLPLSTNSLAVVSVGKDNVYQHPNPDAIDKHRRAGWQVQFTSGVSGIVRNDRRIG